MFNEEVRGLLVQVITSWQVIAVTIVLVIYMFLINYVAKIYYNRPGPPSMPKKKKSKSAAPEASAPSPTSDDDELGLEEASPDD